MKFLVHTPSLNYVGEVFFEGFIAESSHRVLSTERGSNVAFGLPALSTLDFHIEADLFPLSVKGWFFCRALYSRSAL